MLIKMIMGVAVLAAASMASIKLPGDEKYIIQSVGNDLCHKVSEFCCKNQRWKSDDWCQNRMISYIEKAQSESKKNKE